MIYLACVGAEWGRRVVAAVPDLGEIPPLPSPSLLGRALDAAAFPGAPVFFLNWSYIVPPEVTTAYDCINFHCTALPYGRGGHPIENLILRGHEETVITAHRMTDVVDGGPVYGAAGPVSLAGTKAEILDRFVEPVAELIRWIIEERPAALPQCGEPVRFRRLSQEEYEAVWRGREEEEK